MELGRRAQGDKWHTEKASLALGSEHGRSWNEPASNFSLHASVLHYRSILRLFSKWWGSRCFLSAAKFFTECREWSGRMVEAGYGWRIRQTQGGFCCASPMPCRYGESLMLPVSPRFQHILLHFQSKGGAQQMDASWVVPSALASSSNHLHAWLARCPGPPRTHAGNDPSLSALLGGVGHGTRSHRQRYRSHFYLGRVIIGRFPPTSGTLWHRQLWLCFAQTGNHW